jgi:simple sugar transport system permease protein
MSATLLPPQPSVDLAPDSAIGRFKVLMATNPLIRASVLCLGFIWVLAVARVLADAPDMTSGPTFIAAVGATAPILFAGLGAMYSERVGVVNIGLDGMMVLGTWFAGWAGWQYGPYAALVAGAFGGALGGLLHALATVTFGVDQVVSGIAINLIAPGVTRFLSSEVFAGNEDGTITQSPTMSESVGHFTMPFTSGGNFFGWHTPNPLGWISEQRWFYVSDVAGFLVGFTTDMAYSTMLALVLVPISVYVLWHMRFGLRLRSIGEKPSAADSLGVAVYKMKYVGVTLSGALAGLGGAWLVLDVRAYNQDQVAGRGFQGLAATIFGNWRPVGILTGSGLFAYSQALTQRLGTNPVRALFLVAFFAFLVLAINALRKGKFPSAATLAIVGAGALLYFMSTTEIDSRIVFITPYVVTLVVLTFSSQRLRPPAAEGKPWRKGDTG